MLNLNKFLNYEGLIYYDDSLKRFLKKIIKDSDDLVIEELNEKVDIIEQELDKKADIITEENGQTSLKIGIIILSEEKLAKIIKFIDSIEEVDE